MLFILFFPAIAFADVYKYVDVKGHIYYSDNPKNARYVRIVRSMSDKEIANYFRQKRIAENNAYNAKVKATAKFLDDVEKHRKHH